LRWFATDFGRFLKRLFLTSSHLRLGKEGKKQSLNS
jgi:hypothetical protein